MLPLVEAGRFDVDVRCPSRIQFRVEDERIEIMCSSKHCGAGNGAVILHYYNAITFEFIETVKYRNPAAYLERK